MKHFWIKIDLRTDEIVAMADTQKELAEICGVKHASVRQHISRAKRTGRKCCYVCILEDEEGND